MFFSGDPTIKKKVDLGGRSTRERDRQKLLEQTKLEREQRHRSRVQSQSATRIQKFLRGRKAVAAERPIFRSEFCSVYGEFGERANREAFYPASKYLPQLFFFFDANNTGDIHRLVGACRLLQRLRSKSTIWDLFTVDGNPDWGVAEHRHKNFAYLCINALYNNRTTMKVELLRPVHTPVAADDSAILLLETLLTLTGDGSPWAGTVMDHLLQNKLFHLLRGILLEVQPLDRGNTVGVKSCLEHAVCCLAKRYLQRLQAGISLPVQWGFASQLLSIPLLWQCFPYLKQVCVNEGLWAHSIHQIASYLQEFITLLPPDTTPGFPSRVCLLGNLVDAAEPAVSRSDSSIKLGTDFAVVARYLIEELPAHFFISTRAEDDIEDEMDIDGIGKTTVPEPALEQQLHRAGDYDLLKHLVRLTLPETVAVGPPSDAEAVAVGAICAFLYSLFAVLPMNVVITGLAYTAQLVPHLWPYMKQCHKFNSWPAMELVGRSTTETQLSGESLGWMLPLSVFCPVYRVLLLSIDNEEFYELQRPIPLDDIVLLVTIVKEALWQLLWVLSSKGPTGPVQKHVTTPPRIFSSLSFRQRISSVASRVLAELHDRNSRRQFTAPHLFHARETVDENFFAQAEGEHTRARELLLQAPFLVPFTDRVRIYTSQLAAARQQSSSHSHLGRHRIKIRRDRIIEDAFALLNNLPEEVLKGTIRVTFVNELGVEEAGVDGGGIFKDFMENVTKVAFAIQYGLFKETADHLLYPNPASDMVHDDHLHYFEFLGKILGKAMFEGILVDIPFATFFLSKLRKKHNYLHDLPSLDPELYRSLLILKNYKGDLADLSVYFVVVNNEYGEQNEIELVEGGRDIQVTNSNVINYIYKVAHHRLNSQIREQSEHFLHGFQQLIKPEWIGMFNEQELQILISGSQEGMDVNDLQNNVHYAGGYDAKHPVIEMFWEVVQTLDSDLQRKFLKFVTGCSRGPLLGFKYLEPQFCIQRAAPDDASEETLDRLPTSATCMNLLKLPPYRSKEIIHEKLLYAITAGAGFDLS
ncbi:hypothetical protein CY35_12G070200 [Sphagnum magellanicum]|nr:hypothetical protein CY35_12G070200 [Sphagnum magellanicum]KAH9545896.1 hypothetical protein CY35_12G070200 [Sphagnum magellanicum]